MSSTGFQEKALQNRAAISLISPTSNERMPVKQRLLDGRQVSVPPHQVAVLSEQPNLVIVNPQTSTPAAWNGSESFVDFELPDQLHVVTGLNLAMTVNFSGTDAANTTTAAAAITTDATAATANAWEANGRKIGVGMPPTPYWCSRVEVYAGKDIIETIYNEALYNDAVAWRDIQNRREWSRDVNFTADVDTTMSATNALAITLPYRNSDGSDRISFSKFPNSTLLPDATSLPQSQFWNNGDSGKLFYLPLSCCLTQGKVFASGFVVPFKVRVYFAPSITSSVSPSISSATPTVLAPAGTAAPTLNQVQLWVSEQQLSSVNFEAKLREHRNGNVLYKFVMKNRFQQAITTPTGTTPTTVQLKAFKSLSSGLVLTITKAQPSIAQCQERCEVQQIQLLDAVGRRITEVQPDALNRRFVFPRHIASDYSVYREQYLVPFSSDFGETVRNAVNLGYNQMTTLEQLQFILTAAGQATAGANCMINIYSYDYATLACNGGVPQVSYT